MGMYVSGMEEQLQTKSDKTLQSMTPTELVNEQKRLQKLGLLHAQHAMQQQSMAVRCERECTRVVHFLGEKLKAK